MIEVARRADVLVNVSGMLTDEGLLQCIPVRVYLDLDPAFIQLWQEAQGIDMRFAGHTHFVTVGLALGTPDCVVPTCGLEWVTTTQPVVLEHWPVAGPITHDALTTVGNWRGYGSIEYEGVFYGQKVHSWRPLIHLPRLTPDRFSPALAIHPGETNDLAALHENGWCLLDPASVAATPDEYRDFIRGSKAEFGVAKSGYVASRCGWFSDRSACYLASGRPVIAQETGFRSSSPHRGRFVRLRDGRRRARRDRRDQRRLSPSLPGGPRHRRAVLRLRQSLGHPLGPSRADLKQLGGNDNDR